MTRLTRSVVVRSRSLALALLVCLGLVAAGSGAGALGSTGPAAPGGAHQERAHTRGGYLALGDSVSFGYREPANLPTPDYSDASSFVGYPELVADALHLQLANAACPGETSASLVKPNAPSNGCETSPNGNSGYRALFPLHVQYTGTQLAYAVSYLRQHRDTRLVSLMIGANDGFLCQTSTPDACASETGRLASRIQAKVTKILRQIRERAGYQGQIVIVDYYSLDYRSPQLNGFSQLLNSAVNQAAAPFDVKVADGYAAFSQAAAQTEGDTCRAGLLTFLTSGGCGIHPSIAGQSVLAQTVEAQVRR